MAYRGAHPCAKRAVDTSVATGPCPTCTSASAVSAELAAIKYEIYSNSCRSQSDLAKMSENFDRLADAVQIALKSNEKLSTSPFLTVEEAANYFRQSKNTFYKMKKAASSEFPREYKFAGRSHFRRAEIEKWAESRVI